MNEWRPKLKIQTHSIVIGHLVDSGAHVTIILSEYWHPNWPLQYVNIQFFGIRTSSQIRQSTICVDYLESEEERGIMKPNVYNTEMNLWGRDLLPQWNTQINITPILETNHKLTSVYEIYCKVLWRTVTDHSGSKRTGQNSCCFSKSTNSPTFKMVDRQICMG